MTLPQILDAMNAAAREARERGATDAEVSAIRAEIFEQHRVPGGDRQPVNTWQPHLSAEEREPEPKRCPVNPGRTHERKGDLF